MAAASDHAAWQVPTDSDPQPGCSTSWRTTPASHPSTGALGQAQTPAAGPASPPSPSQHALTQGQQPLSRARTCMLVLAWSLCSLTYGLLLSIVGPTAVLLAERTHSTPSDLAPVLGMGGICTLIGAMPSGWLIDRLPGNPLLAGVLLIQAAGYAVMPLCTSVAWLTLVYATISLTFNVINTGLNVMVIWSFQDPQQMALVLNTVSAVFGLGGILAPQLVTLAAVAGDGALCYSWTAACAVVTAMLLVGLPSPTDQQQQQHLFDSQTVTAAPVTPCNEHHRPPASHEEAPQYRPPSPIKDTCQSTGNFQPHLSMEDLQPKACLLPGQAAHGSAAGTASVLLQGGDTRPFIPELAEPVIADPVLAISQPVIPVQRPWMVLAPALVVVFANVSIELGYAAWIFTYARDIGGMPDAQAETMTSLFWLLFVLGRALAAVLATCIRSSTLLLASMPLAIVGSVIPLVVPGSGSTVASVLLVGLGAACGFPSTLSIAAQYAHLDGAMNGLISTVAGLSMTLMPAIVPMMAKLSPSFGFSWLMVATLVMALTQWIGLWQLLRAGAAHKRALALSLHSAQGVCHAPPLDAGYPYEEDDLQAPLIISSAG